MRSIFTLLRLSGSVPLQHSTDEATGQNTGLAPGNIPLDLPLPGRTLYVQFQHKL
jgi:hypothetical protein